MVQEFLIEFQLWALVRIKAQTARKAHDLAYYALEDMKLKRRLGKDESATTAIFEFEFDGFNDFCRGSIIEVDGIPCPDDPSDI